MNKMIKKHITENSKGRVKTYITIFSIILSIMLVSGLIIKAADSSAAENKQESCYKSFEELNGKRVAMLSGAPFADTVSEYVEDAKFSYYDSFADILLALKSGKIDAGLNNSAVAEYQSNKDSDLAVMDKPLKELSFGIAFNKGDKEQEKWKKALEEVGEEKIQELWDIWIGSDESAKVLPEQDWPGKNGTVKVATLDNLEPMGYRREGEKIVGFDSAVILACAEKLDVKVEFQGMELAAVLPAVASGKADFTIASLIITKERTETMDMIPYHSGNIVLITRSEEFENQAGKGSEKSFFAEMKDNFKKTFVTDKRYMLILEGVGATVLISLLSGVLGILFGFLLVYLRRISNPVINVFIRILEEIFVGLPAAVILLVLCYVVFGKVIIPGVIVAIIGFTLMFGVKAYTIIQSALEAVDKGQMEAALSLGYTPRKAFTKIILPQAKKIYFPILKNQFTILVKDTSVVGFIAVIDITRAGDLIRSRTLEAFFPLITVAVIYYIIIKMFSWIINLFDKKSSEKSIGMNKETAEEIN